MKKGEERDWQWDPAMIQAKKVHAWTPRGMLITTQMPLKEAQRMVAIGAAFVYSKRAIEYFDHGLGM